MTRFLASIFPLSLLVGCLPLLPDVQEPCGEWPDPGLFRLKVEPTDSRTRKPYIYVPDSTGPRDVIYLLHGGASSGPEFAEVSDFRSYADEFGFVIVYPNGLGWPVRQWNSGPAYDPDGDEQDDVAFLEQLAATVSPKVCARRTFASGFSQGAMMAHRWACEGDALDALGVSSGPPMIDACTNPPVPTLHFHGISDPIIPFDGGVERGITFPPVESAFGMIRKRNGCTDVAEVETRGDTTCTSWACDVPTELCTITGWGHQWPGGINAGGTEANATEEVLGFLNDAVPLDDTGASTPTEAD